MNQTDYPVLEVLGELKRTLADSPVVILQAPPGAGKSTVLPLQLLGEPWLGGRRMIMLEPRRLAARAVAGRMANLLDEQPGETVGYRIRFESTVTAKTRIEVVTEGILTRMLQGDNTLDDYSLVIFDEFHERSIHADLALALTLQVQQVLRPDLRILIMSATLDAKNLSAILGDAPVITSSGRQHPVEIRYAPQESDQPVPVRVAATTRRLLREETGDILVFLPGAGEIRRVEELLRSEDLYGSIVYPLYGDLTFRRQQEAILPHPAGARKIVLATSIAETSLTIEGIRVVVDAGLARVPRFDPRSGLTRLDTIRVTRDAADQRAGRAGRLGPGVCYRLWTEAVHRTLADQRKPEILEADLAPLVLDLAQWGVREVAGITWITPPPPGAVAQGRDLLERLGATKDGALTAQGREMLTLPAHPRIAHLIVAARGHRGDRALALATDLAALLDERDPLERESGTDIFLRVEAFRRWRRGDRGAGDRTSFERIERGAQSWRRIVRGAVDNEPPDETLLGQLVLSAYPDRIAQQQGKHNARYKLVNGRMASLPAHDPLIRQSYLVVPHLDAGSGEGRIFLACSVRAEDIVHEAQETTSVRWDEERGAVVAVREKRLGALMLESRPHGQAPAAERIAVLCEVIRQSELRILGDAAQRRETQGRILSLHHWRKTEPWPPVTDEYLLAHLEEWLGPFLEPVSRRSELEKLNMHEILVAGLPYELQSKLDRLAPARLEVPSGSMIKVNYPMDGSPPVIEVRLQEMFGLADTPAVNEGRVPVVVHLLSPGYKPVQVTQDLRSFWQTTYHEVRKELRMRYPRHHWPEDPWTAEAVRGAKRRN